MTPSNENTPTPATPLQLAGRTVVVIDDDTSLLTLMRNYLRRTGANVLVAENGRDAWTLLEQLTEAATPPHAVICDLRMQGGSGMELYRRICTERPALKGRVVFSSGDISSDDVRTFMEQCDAPVLEKPFPLANLRQMLADMPPLD